MTLDVQRNMFLVVDRLVNEWIKGAIYMVMSRVQYKSQLHCIIFDEFERPKNRVFGGAGKLLEDPDDITPIHKQCDECEYVVGNRLNDIYTTKEGIVLRDASTNQFYGFRNVASAMNFLNAHPEMKYFHEIISRWRQHRIYFDIDAKYDVDIDIIKKHICTIFHIRYGFKIQASDIIEYKSIRPDKFGYHLIINDFNVLGTEVKTMNTLLKASLPEEMRDVVDILGKNNGSLRMPGMFKPGGDTCYEVKKGWCIKYPFISSMPARIFLTSYDAVNLEESHHVFDGDVKPTIDKIEAMGDHRVYEVKGSIVTFKRIRPSHCNICNRIHETDNTAYLVLRKDGTHRLKCRHAEAEKYEHI
jgi:hypothetical protein